MYGYGRKRATAYFIGGYMPGSGVRDPGSGRTTCLAAVSSGQREWPAAPARSTPPSKPPRERCLPRERSGGHSRRRRTEDCREVDRRRLRHPTRTQSLPCRGWHLEERHWLEGEQEWLQSPDG